MAEAIYKKPALGKKVSNMEKSLKEVKKILNENKWQRANPSIAVQCNWGIVLLVYNGAVALRSKHTRYNICK